MVAASSISRLVNGCCGSIFVTANVCVAAEMRFVGFVSRFKMLFNLSRILCPSRDTSMMLSIAQPASDSFRSLKMHRPSDLCAPRAAIVAEDEANVVDKAEKPAADGKDCE